MNDLISRQAVLKLLSTMPPEEAITKAMLIQNVKYMSAAQPEKRTEERTEKHACDCISRKAAIERAIKDHDFYKGATTPADKARRDELLNVMCWLGELPSAQPYTDEEIQKMQDIEQAQLDKAYEMGKADALRWIPCSERLPEEAGWYIASGVRDVGNRWYSTLHGWEETTFRVVAWMPLPEPYKEDDHD